VLNQPATVRTAAGQALPRRMTVASVSFSAHVDYAQNRDFIRATAPPHVVLVHGEANEMDRFKRQLLLDYEVRPPGARTQLP
jgi:cleavage and polyadenylation specificity factor subunit 3